MSFHQRYVESQLKMNSINLPASDMMHNNVSNTTNSRPTSDPSFNFNGKPLLLQQNNPYVKSMLYDRENVYSDIISIKNAMGSKSLYMNPNFKSSEAEAIDKIFEDLSCYEKTLEEMANAKLDDEFKEELAAIEQWFSVLSECERTTVLYSLIQNISELQVRFFLTLLQQKVKNNPLYNSIIKRPISDSIYSSSTKHCSNTSSETSSMINSTSADTFYDDEEYQKNSFVDSNISNKNTTNQFSCPLNMNEYNMAMNSLSNANLLNERTSSLSRPSSTKSQHSHATSHSNPSSNTTSPVVSRKNSYMNSMMNDYSSYNTNPSNQNLNVIRDMNSVILNSMATSTPSSQTMLNSQFLSTSQPNLMVNNSSSSLYSNDSQRMTSFPNNSNNNLSLLNQNTINTLMNSNPLTLLNTSTPSSSSTSALPVLSPTSSSLTLLGSNNPTSPIVNPIRPPKTFTRTNHIRRTSNSNKNNNNNINNNTNSLNVPTSNTTATTTTTITNDIITSTLTTTLQPTPVAVQKPIIENLKEASKEKENEKVNEKEKENDNENEKGKAAGKTLTEILLNGKETKDGNKNASILSDILTLSKEMNDMVNKNKEKKKEKLIRSATTSPVANASPKIKKALSEDGEVTSQHTESVTGTTTNHNPNPSREKGKIPDQIDLEALEDMPAFLRSLRLHKYAPAFEGLNWKQIIKLDNDELLKRGVITLGARNKMLKVFDLIKAEANKQNVSLD